MSRFVCEDKLARISGVDNARPRFLSRGGGGLDGGETEVPEDGLAVIVWRSND